MDKKLEIIENVDEVNAMPQIALDIMSLINEPGTTISDLSKKVKLDEALAAFILKNCNSPLYGIRSEINSIPQALTLLGFSIARSILMSYFTKNLYNLSGKNEINRKLWIHSISVASFSQAIASKINENQEEAYLAGLLHDIGKLIMYASDNSAFEKVLDEIQSTGTESYIIEEKLLGYDHMQIGTLIMKKWKFSRKLIEIAQLHHSVMHYNDTNKFIAIIAFANLLTQSEVDEERVDFSFFTHKYNLSETKLEEIISKGLELKKSYLSF